MKTKILKLSTIALLVIMLTASCNKDELDYADESIIVSNNPGTIICKTNLDYLDKVWVDIIEDRQLNRITSLSELNLVNFTKDKHGNLYPKFRHILKSGYVVGDARLQGACTNITFKEYYEYNLEHEVNHWPDELIWPRIIDEDPFEEIYAMACLDCQQRKEFTLGQINEMIENGTLEEHFTRLK